MRFGECSRGQMAEITLTSGANLRLLDLTSCSNYGRGERPQYSGRFAKQPVRLKVPKSVHWHVAVDMQGLEGSTCSSIRKLPRPLPELREAPCSVPSLVRDSCRREHSRINEQPFRRGRFVRAVRKAGRTTNSTESPLGLSNGSNSFYPPGISRPKHCYQHA
ncbi:DUF1883 domain-containing protein [Mesorhizobium sp. M0139]|uniref:DUF1883 domain-containing protein n=1 Tax=Mesorhizobium sp. M0139 TaxID=2956892 RepID=UPI00333DC866